MVVQRLNLKTGEYEFHQSDEGWTNLRWEPGFFVFTPEGDLLTWHYEAMNVARLTKE